MKRMLCLLNIHDWEWERLPGRTFHGTLTCLRCGTSRTSCFQRPDGQCPDLQHKRLSKLR